MEEGTRDILDATLKFTRLPFLAFSSARCKAPGSCSTFAACDRSTEDVKNSHLSVLINLK